MKPLGHSLTIGYTVDGCLKGDLKAALNCTVGPLADAAMTPRLWIGLRPDSRSILALTLRYRTRGL